MIAGSKLSCIGIVGDGCGGGREFVVADGVLYAKDPVTNEKIILLEGIVDALSLRKSACILYIECKEQSIKFDLSLLQRI
jgi:hypothetical protein